MKPASRQSSDAALPSAAAKTRARAIVLCSLYTDLGKLEFAFRLYHNPAYVFPTPVRFLQKDVLSRPANVLLVHVVRGKGLPIMDPNMMSKGGSSDPFVKLAFSGFSEKTAVKNRAAKESEIPNFKGSFPKNLRDFIQPCFESGYELEGEGNVTKRLSSAIYNRDDITLYLDAPAELYDFFEEQLFDFFAR